MRRHEKFRYLHDRLFIFALAAYALNRLLIRPHLGWFFHSHAEWLWPLLHSHFDDLLLMPAALPVILGFYLLWKKGRIRRKEAIGLIPFFLVGLGLGVVTLWFQVHRAIGLGEAPPPGRIASAAIACKLGTRAIPKKIGRMLGITKPQRGTRHRACWD